VAGEVDRSVGADREVLRGGPIDERGVLRDLHAPHELSVERNLREEGRARRLLVLERVDLDDERSGRREQRPEDCVREKAP
jgi:hypothetical protein